MKIHCFASLLVLLILVVPMVSAQEIGKETATLEAVTVEEGNPIIARWSGGEVRQNDFLGWLAHRKLDEVDAATKQAEIEQMLLTQQLATAAIERGAHVELAAALNDIEYSYWQRAWRQTFDAAVKITDEELDRLAKANATAFDQPRKVRLRNLFLRFPEGADEAQKAEVRHFMTELQQELAEGADFAELARRHSDSESRYRGGLMSVVSAGDLTPKVDRVVMALVAGQVSEVQETAAGLMLLKCDKVHEAVKLSLAEVRNRIEINLRRMRVGKRWQDEKQRWFDSAQPVYELKSALDPEAKPDAVVLRFTGDLSEDAKRQGQLTVGDLELLLAQKLGKPRSDLGSEVLRQLLEEKAVTWLAWRRAKRDGLATASGKAAPRIFWRQNAMLARHEIVRRVEKVFERPAVADVRAFFERSREMFRRLPRYELDLILLDADPKDPRPAFELAERLTRQVKNGEFTFSAAARRFSQHPSASNGGHLGNISRRAIAQFGPDPYHAVTSLEPGEISTPVRYGDKVWVFRLVSFEEQRPLSFEEAQSRVEQKFAEQRLEELQKKTLASLRAGLAVQLAGS